MQNLKTNVKIVADPTTIRVERDIREKIRHWALVGENYNAALVRILTAAENCRKQHQKQTGGETENYGQK
jgi:hypothetical protein